MPYGNRKDGPSVHTGVRDSPVDATYRYDHLFGVLSAFAPLFGGR